MLSQQPPISRRFDSEQEHRFFQLYCDDIAIQIPGPLKTTIWERIIPQMCDAEPFVRHAVVGISALTVINRDEHPRRGSSSHPLNHAQHFRDRNRSLYEFALMQYDKSSQDDAESYSRQGTRYKGSLDCMFARILLSKYTWQYERRRLKCK
jgi:hypothetical protein